MTLISDSPVARGAARDARFRGRLGREDVVPGGLSRGELGRGELGREEAVPGALGRGELGRLVAGIAGQAGRWRDLVRYDPVQRWYHRMELTDEYELWLLSWQPGQRTGFHDHGGSVGAFAVALGELQEQTVRGRSELAVRPVGTGGVRSFGARYVHNVVNHSAGPAVSVHAYSPPLPQMRRYELTPGGLRHTGTEPAEVIA